MRARLSRERSAAILSSMRHFRLGSLLHIRPLQFCPLDGMDFRPFAHNGLPRQQHQSSEAVVQRSLQPGGSPGFGDIAYRGHGRIGLSPGSSVRGHTGFVAMVRTSEPVAHKPHGAGSSDFSVPHQSFEDLHRPFGQLSVS